jgi:hypothetical protein
MFIGLYGKMVINREGIICKSARYLHTIPSGLAKTLLNFPINIYSLREYMAKNNYGNIFNVLLRGADLGNLKNFLNLSLIHNLSFIIL